MLPGPIVEELVIYPVKSCGGISVDAWTLEGTGLRFDRRFMVVDHDGRFVTQRTHPVMCTIQPVLDVAGGRLILSAPGRRELAVPSMPQTTEACSVQVWSDRVVASTVSDDADAWFSDVLGDAVRLVHFPSSSTRTTNPAYGAGFHTSFADGFAVLIAGRESLDDLNARLAVPVPMDRFRPNIVVAGSPPFAEDDWHDVAIAGAALRVVKPCGRCVIANTDQRTTARAREPLRTLATFRRRDGKVMFGQNAHVVRAGTISVGDAVTLVAP
jgi:uncharacterized protein YcbX